MFTLSEVVFQPLHTLQSRFVLQKHAANYKIYPSILSALSKTSLKELYQGTAAILGINLIKLSLMYTLGVDDGKSFVLQFWLSTLLTYPLLTLQRNKECYSSTLNTMLNEGKSLLYLQATYRDIIRVKGFAGLYSGILGHLLIVSSAISDSSAKHFAWNSLVPLDQLVLATRISLEFALDDTTVLRFRDAVGTICCT